MIWWLSVLSLVACMHDESHKNKALSDSWIKYLVRTPDFDGNSGCQNWWRSKYAEHHQNSSFGRHSAYLLYNQFWHPLLTGIQAHQKSPSSSFIFSLPGASRNGSTFLGPAYQHHVFPSRRWPRAMVSGFFWCCTGCSLVFRITCQSQRRLPEMQPGIAFIAHRLFTFDAPSEYRYDHGPSLWQAC